MYNHVYFLYKEYLEKVVQSQIYDFLSILKSSTNNKVILVILISNYNENDMNKLKELLKIYNIESDAIFIKYNIFNVYNNNLIYYKKVLTKIESKLIYDKTLFHCRSHIATSFAIKLRNISKNSCKVLYDNRGLPIEENTSSNIVNRIKKRLHLLLIRYSAKYCDYYSFVTYNLKKYLIDNYKYDVTKEYIVVPTCVNKKNIKGRTQVRDDRNKYIFVGNTAKHQNIDKIIELMSKIQKIDTKSKFIFLVNDVPKVELLLKNTTIDCLVKNVKNKEVFEYLLQSKVGILIRDNTIINKVAAPTKLSEYIACGLKIIYSGEIGSLTDYGNCFDNCIFNLDQMSLENIIEKININSKVDESYFLWETHINKYYELLN